MPRPFCLRRVACEPMALYYKPAGIPVRSLIIQTLYLDELEALRLADLEGLYHDQGAERMQISRATFGRILEAARRKVADALVHGKALRIVARNQDQKGEMMMPRGDGTGPMGGGRGQGRGQGRGPCGRGLRRGRGGQGASWGVRNTQRPPSDAPVSDQIKNPPEGRNAPKDQEKSS